MEIQGRVLNVHLAEREINRIINIAKDGNASINDVSSFWGKIVDFFCRTHREEAKRHFFKMADPKSSNIEKINAYNQLCELISEPHKDKLQHVIQADGDAFNVTYRMNGGDGSSSTLFEMRFTPGEQTKALYKRLEEFSGSDEERAAKLGQLVKELELEDYERDDTAARTFQHHFRALMKRVKEKEANEYDFIKMESVRGGTNSTFYFDKHRKLSHLTKPRYDSSANCTEGGTFKEIAGRDNKNIELRVKDPNFPAKKFNEIARALVRFKYIVQSGYVENKTILAIDYKSDLHHLRFTERKEIPLCAFRGIVEEMGDMHKNNFFLTDIKPENMILDKGGNARHIDPDMCIIGDKEGKIEIKNVGGTPEYITSGIVDGKEFGNQKEKKKACEAHDQFAMLQTMMKVTGDPNLVSAVADFNRDFAERGLSSGVKITHAHEIWISKNILPEYRDEIKRFLGNPIKHKLGMPLDAAIKWD